MDTVWIKKDQLEKEHMQRDAEFSIYRPNPE